MPTDMHKSPAFAFYGHHLTGRPGHLDVLAYYGYVDYNVNCYRVSGSGSQEQTSKSRLGIDPPK